jgi:PleD family two-component response regulator
MLKSIPNMLNCPIIFSTAVTSTEQEIKCWDAGAADLVSKPLVVQTLVKRIRTHIQAKLQAILIENMVFIDSQTDVYNRRYFNGCYEKQISLTRRNDDPIFPVMYELNNFALFDEQSPPIASIHLRTLAHLISDELSRPTDTLVRYSENKLQFYYPKHTYLAPNTLFKKY